MTEKLSTFGRTAGGEGTPDDAVVERHLAEMQAAYAALDSDPVTAAQLDAVVLDADRELTPSKRADQVDRVVIESEADWRVRQEIRELDALRVRQQEELQELQVIRARLDIETRPRSSKSRWMGRASLPIPSLAIVTSWLMIAATVLLGIFGNFAHISTILPIFGATPALTALVGSFMHFYIVRCSARPGPESKNAYRTLRLLQQEPSLDLREIEAREAVATAAVRASSPQQQTSLELDSWRLQTYYPS